MIMGYTLWLLGSNSRKMGSSRSERRWPSSATFCLQPVEPTRATRLLRTRWQHIGKGLDPTWPPPLWNHCTCLASVSRCSFPINPYHSDMNTLGFWHMTTLRTLHQSPCWRRCHRRCSWKPPAKWRCSEAVNWSKISKHGMEAKITQPTVLTSSIYPRLFAKNDIHPFYPVNTWYQRLAWLAW